MPVTGSHRKWLCSWPRKDAFCNKTALDAHNTWKLLSLAGSQEVLKGSYGPSGLEKLRQNELCRRAFTKPIKCSINWESLSSLSLFRSDLIRNGSRASQTIYRALIIQLNEQVSESLGRPQVLAKRKPSAAVPSSAPVLVNGTLLESKMSSSLMRQQPPPTVHCSNLRVLSQMSALHANVADDIDLNLVTYATKA